MSRNNKNAKNLQAARKMSEQRQKGNKGPAKTEAKHGKKNAWWQRFESYGAFIRREKAAKKD